MYCEISLQILLWRTSLYFAVCMKPVVVGLMLFGPWGVYFLVWISCSWRIICLRIRTSAYIIRRRDLQTWCAWLSFSIWANKSGKISHSCLQHMRMLCHCFIFEIWNLAEVACKIISSSIYMQESSLFHCVRKRTTWDSSLSDSRTHVKCCNRSGNIVCGM
jgi:hypothetical protein